MKNVLQSGVYFAFESYVSFLLISLTGVFTFNLWNWVRACSCRVWRHDNIIVNDLTALPKSWLRKRLATLPHMLCQSSVPLLKHYVYACGVSRNVCNSKLTFAFDGVFCLVRLKRSGSVISRLLGRGDLYMLPVRSMQPAFHEYGDNPSNGICRKFWITWNKRWGLRSLAAPKLCSRWIVLLHQCFLCDVFLSFPLSCVLSEQKNVMCVIRWLCCCSCDASSMRLSMAKAKPALSYKLATFGGFVRRLKIVWSNSR